MTRLKDEKAMATDRIGNSRYRTPASIALIGNCLIAAMLFTVTAVPEAAAQQAEKSAVFTQPTYFQPDRAVGGRPARLGRQPGRRQCLGDAHRQQHGGRARSRSATSRRASRSTRTTSSPIVANAAGSSVTVIRIINPTVAGFRAASRSTLTHRRRAVEHRDLARRQAGLRRQQRPGHDHGDQRR